MVRAELGHFATRTYQFGTGWGKFCSHTGFVWSFIGNVSNRLHREYNKSLFSSTIYIKARFALNKVQLIIYGQSPKVWDAGVSENNLIEMKNLYTLCMEEIIIYVTYGGSWSVSEFFRRIQVGVDQLHFSWFVNPELLKMI